MLVKIYHIVIMPQQFNSFYLSLIHSSTRSRHGRDSMAVGFTTTYAISAYHH